MIDVANFGKIIRLSDMECCAFIRYLVIEFADNGKTLKLPKTECFSVQNTGKINISECVNGILYINSAREMDVHEWIASVK